MKIKPNFYFSSNKVKNLITVDSVLEQSVGPHSTSN